MKQKVVRYLVRATKWMGAERIFINAPLTHIGTREWIDKNTNAVDAKFISLEEPQRVREIKPVVIGHPISARFTRNYERTTREAFIALIPRARVFGEFSNLIISPDNRVLSDVSREFGAEGGKKPEKFSIFHNNFRMPSLVKLKGKVAVISTCGANNFHHWNFDVLPRLELISRAGLLKEIDQFIIHHAGLKFQLEGLGKFKIQPDQIINPKGKNDFYIEAEYLVIPSLPEDLGTISPWVIDFLRKTFLNGREIPVSNIKLFLSRRNAPSRKIINDQEVSGEILSRGFQEFIPEDHTMEEVAGYFSKAASIVSVHGSALSNLPFIEAGTKVLDIMAPFHQDPYYWMMCNVRKAKYVAVFAEGNHPDDNLDLVKSKVDDDLLIDINKLKAALDQIS